jgi:dCMP deaminase
MAKEEERISRGAYFKELIKLTSKRSSCHKKSVGAALVRDNRVIATGYNGVLPKEKHSMGLDVNGVTHTVHAEVNIIAFCAKNGISTEGTTLYTTLSPCEKCAEIIIQSGIKQVLYIEEYRDDKGLIKLRENDILIGLI